MIKEKIQSFIINLKTLGLSERMALTITVLAFVLVFVVVIVIINFILPKTRIEISISGPETVKIGEEAIYTVTIKNTGTVILKNPELVFQYPTLSLPEKGLIQTEKFETLYPEEEKKFTFKGQLFGSQGETREFKTWLNYSTESDLTIRTTKIASLSTSISEVPIDLVLNVPQKAPIYLQEKSRFTFRIRYFFSGQTPISNVKLLVEPPADFIFQESIPVSLEGKEFTISKLEPSVGGEFEISGTLPAGYEFGKTLEFKANLLVHLPEGDVLLKTVSAQSTTFKPAFLFSQKINNAENYSPYPGEKLYYQIYFRNIQEEPIRDLSLTIVLDSPLYDLNSIEAPLGNIAKGSNSISWNGEQVSELRYITPGQESKVEFWVNLKDDYQPKNLTETNVFIRDRIILAGFETEFRQRVNSLVKISQEGYFKDPYGFFENTGPHPPKVNESTFYTIVWKIENWYNPIENVAIKASLPKGVSVQKIKSPPEGEINVTTYPAPLTVPYPDIPTSFRFEKPLYEGLRETEVVYLQLILKREVPRLYPSKVAATGYFGSITRESLKGFQEKYGLVPTGVTDESTCLKLNELLVKAAPPSFAEVTLTINELEPGKGILEDPLIAAFQVVFTPELNQQGKVATLINEARFSAKDKWTSGLLTASDEAIDTTLPDDYTFHKVGGVVQ